MQHGKLFINAQWQDGSGQIFNSTNPADGSTIWQGAAATPHDVNLAIQAASNASESWADLGVEARIPYLESFRELLEQHKQKIAQAIGQDMGKPIWEALTEVGAMIAKINHSINAYNQRCAPFQMDLAPGQATLNFRPHGVVAIFGPFNFPGHVPNGHIVPALLAGNTIVFKPSELVPMSSQLIIELWEQTNLLPGVINLIQGSIDTGKALTNHPQINGLFFTGSARVGCALQHALADRPGTILALELGGNNPLIVDQVDDHTAAAYTTILSAYITTGQRCTCASRLIVPKSKHNDQFLDRLLELIPNITIANPTTDPEPFMGPVVNANAAQKLLAGQQQLVNQGGQTLIEMKPHQAGPAFLTPGLIDVTNIENPDDEELFGPIMQLTRVDNINDAITEANNTRYGLAAAILTDDKSKFESFIRRIRAGVVNWNKQTTGASSRLPFGGVGISGNHRPSGFFAADYCSWPISSLQTPTLDMPQNTLPGITL